MDELNELVMDQLKDIHSAERQALRCMQKALRSATAPMLRTGIERHIEQTEAQIERVQQALEQMGGKPGRKVCEAMRGLVEEAQGEIEEHEKGSLMDLVIAAGMQRIEHYEIAAYGTVVAVAQAMGQPRLGELLRQTLAEEEETSRKLTELSQSILKELTGGAEAAAQEAPGGEAMGGAKKKRSTSTARS